MNALPLTLALMVSLMLVSRTAAQQSAEDRIKEKLQAIQTMIQEESGTIAVLEKHLEEAILKDNDASAVRLKEEIGSAEERQKRLTELKDQLKLLMDSVTVPAVERPNIPQRQRPHFGPRRVLRSGAEAPHRAAGIVPDNDGSEHRISQGNNDSNQPTDDAFKNEPESDRIERLRRSYNDLTAAGELEMARQIQELIKREERIVRERQRLREEAARKQRETDAKAKGDDDDFRMERGIARDRDAAPQDKAPRDKAPRDKAKPADNNEMVVELKGVIDDMRQEIKQLRDEIKRLKDEQGDQ